MPTIDAHPSPASEECPCSLPFIRTGMPAPNALWTARCEGMRRSRAPTCSHMMGNKHNKSWPRVRSDQSSSSFWKGFKFSKIRMNKSDLCGIAQFQLGRDESRLCCLPFLLLLEGRERESLKDVWMSNSLMETLYASESSTIIAQSGDCTAMVDYHRWVPSTITYQRLVGSVERPVYSSPQTVCMVCTMNIGCSPMCTLPVHWRSALNIGLSYRTHTIQPACRALHAGVQFAFLEN